MGMSILPSSLRGPGRRTPLVLGASREGDRSRKAPETVNLRLVAVALCAICPEIGRLRTNRLFDPSDRDVFTFHTNTAPFIAPLATPETANTFVPAYRLPSTYDRPPLPRPASGLALPIAATAGVCV